MRSRSFSRGEAPSTAKVRSGCDSSQCEKVASSAGLVVDFESVLNRSFAMNHRALACEQFATLTPSLLDRAVS